MAGGIHLTEDEVMALQISLAEAEKTIRTLKDDLRHYEKLIEKYQEASLKVTAAISELSVTPSRM